MGVKIYVPVNDVWSFFLKNIDRLSSEMVAIAENTDTEYVVYLTEENRFPLFYVCQGESAPEDEDVAISKDDCAETARRFFAQYLFPLVVIDNKAIPPDSEEDPEDLTRQEMEDAAYERDDELRFAMSDFLQIAIGTDDSDEDLTDIYGDDFIDSILDVVLEKLASEFGISVYRPTLIEDEMTGEQVYNEFPYEDLAKGSIEDSQ